MSAFDLDELARALAPPARDWPTFIGVDPVAAAGAVSIDGVAFAGNVRNRALRDDLADVVRPHLEGYIRQARRRGRTPAELDMVRGVAQGRISVHCRFADDWNIRIELPPRLQRALGTDPASRALMFEVCQAVYAALLEGDREAEQRFSQSRGWLFEQMTPGVLFSDAARGLRERIDSEIFRSVYGTTANVSTANVEPTVEWRAIRPSDMLRAMEELALRAINPSTIAYDAFNDVYIVEADARAAPLTPEAEARGLALLRANLTPAQLAQYDERKSFEVVGSATGKRYRIVHKSTFNVDELDGRGKSVRRLCFAPQGNLVIGDNLLAQKIALETDEAAALAVANVEGDSLFRQCNCPLCTRQNPPRAWLFGEWSNVP